MMIEMIQMAAVLAQKLGEMTFNAPLSLRFGELMGNGNCQRRHSECLNS
jgi:hypothetical protein